MQPVKKFYLAKDSEIVSAILDWRSLKLQNTYVEALPYK
jgi:DNA polymerase-1